MSRFKIFLFSQILVLIFLWIIFSIFWTPDFSWKSSVSDRILKNQNEQISFTWSVISEIDWDTWKFLVKNDFWKEFISISKNLDLNNFLQSKNLDKKFFLEWEIFFDKEWKKFFDVKKISETEKKISEKPKKYFLENKFWWYWFKVDENIFKAVKWWSKTFLKNWSGEVILKFFSFDFVNTNLVKWGFFSDWWIEYELQTETWKIYWEVKSLENWVEIFLKNKESGDFKEEYWVLVEINYWKSEDKENVKKEVYDFLKTFKFIKKENIAKKRCWWKDNLICPEWYFCELFSTSENASWRCVGIK